MRPDPRRVMPPLMLFAAGFGTRMGALTAHQPKPLIHVAGRALIDHALDLCTAAGVAQVVVNLHYRGEQMAAHLRARDVQFSWERDQILETGGGLRAALPLLQGNPVLTLNADVVWTGENPLSRLVAAWDADRMDALLMLLPLAQARGHAGKGDFVMAADGGISRGHGGEDHIYIGAQLLRTDGLADMPMGPFSLNRLWDRQIAAGRAFGVVHRGGWCDVGNPAGITEAEAMLKDAHVF
jgi:N-acetyl-alpha-D-muramate 1-phosphate uridylyltransferase